MDCPAQCSGLSASKLCPECVYATSLVSFKVNEGLSGPRGRTVHNANFSMLENCSEFCQTICPDGWAVHPRSADFPGRD